VMSTEFDRRRANRVNAIDAGFVEGATVVDESNGSHIWRGRDDDQLSMPYVLATALLRAFRTWRAHQGELRRVPSGVLDGARRRARRTSASRRAAVRQASFRAMTWPACRNRFASAPSIRRSRSMRPSG